MRRRLTLAKERLFELSTAELTGVVGAAAALTGEWTCDLDSRLVWTVVPPPSHMTTEGCDTR